MLLNLFLNLIKFKMVPIICPISDFTKILRDDAHRAQDFGIDIEVAPGTLDSFRHPWLEGVVTSSLVSYPTSDLGGGTCYYSLLVIAVIFVLFHEN